MSPIALILNLLLGGLLVAALALGIRLDRRLKALRDSQLGFIKAVAELDQAAAKTRAGLNQWREATDEARELLHDRIEKAKVQSAKLEKLLAQPVPEPLPPRPEPLRPNPAAEAVMTLTSREALRRPRETGPRETGPREGAVRDFPKPSRSRAVIDDDLFEQPAGAAGLQRDLAVALGRRA